MNGLVLLGDRKRRRRRRALIVGLGTALAIVTGGSIATVTWMAWPRADTLVGQATRGDIAGMRWSLRLGVKPNTASRWGFRRDNEGQTALTAAAQFGRVESVRFLLTKGADVNLRDAGGEGVTALATAAMHGQLEVCRALLDAGADPNIPTHPNLTGETREWTALDWATRGNHAEVIALLRERELSRANGGIEY